MEVFQRCHELSGYFSYYSILSSIDSESIRRYSSHWQSWKNDQIDQSDENPAHFQISQTFCWFTKSFVYFKTSLQRTWITHAFGLCSHSDLFKFWSTLLKRKDMMMVA